MTFSHTKGDLFDPAFKFDALAQGVNCEGVMGAGIALPFKQKWPNMFNEYRSLCDGFPQYIPGTLHIWVPENPEQVIVSEEAPLPENPDPIIYNLFSQVMPGKNGEYLLLGKAALMMRQDAENRGIQRVGLPWIGCGIAGLEKHNVWHILAKILHPSTVDFILVEQ